MKKFVAALAIFAVISICSIAAAGASFKNPSPKFTQAITMDLSKPVNSLTPISALAAQTNAQGFFMDVRPERELADAPDKAFSGDAAVQNGNTANAAALTGSATISAPLLTFEGLSNQDNFNIYGGRVNPPDPNAAVGPNHIVEMANLTFAVYNKTGALQAGPFPIGALWQNFSVPDCTGTSGDPVVLYDRQADRWLLSQFTTTGLNPDGSYNGLPFYNCVAISQTSDPTGAYYRYAFITSPPGDPITFFPDYPKYGVWNDSYLLTSRDFGPTVQYGISVYALEKSKMIIGDPNARSVKFFLDSDVIPVYYMGDGLLPADIDGKGSDPFNGSTKGAPIVGSMDDGFVYGAPFDGLNVFELSVKWNQSPPTASFALAAQLPVASFDSTFPCIRPTPTSPRRACIPEPGVPQIRWLDILSYRQRPTFRLAFRSFDEYDAMVTNQSVQAAPGVAGVRWYEIRRGKSGGYSLFQQGTYAPADGVHRWMGSVAMDHRGNIALGYSVSNATDVKPGIRYTGRLKKDPAGQMTLGEATIIDGTGVQVTINNRWGDYTSMNIDPVDDCTFWYTDEYYQVNGVIGINTAPWQTRIGAFQLPGCSK